MDSEKGGSDGSYDLEVEAVCAHSGWPPAFSDCSSEAESEEKEQAKIEDDNAEIGVASSGGASSSNAFGDVHTVLPLREGWGYEEAPVECWKFPNTPWA